MNAYSEVAKNALWKNNPALVQVLGLCPLLAVTGSVVNALGLALATLIVLTGSSLAVSLIRNHVPDAIRLPAFVMIIASLVTSAELLMRAYTFELYLVLGIFIPLIVTNCIILGRADGFARKNKPLLATWDGFMMGVGFGIVLLLLGAGRELIGQGKLFSNMHLLFGESARAWEWVVFDNYTEFLFAILPPGAFIALGLIVAFKNSIDDAFSRKNERKVEVGSKRIRVTS